MSELTFDEQIKQLIKQDPKRMAALRCLRSLSITSSSTNVSQNAYIGAGFIRNRIWDHLHGYEISSPLNDIDVIYYDACNLNEINCIQYEKDLNALDSSFNWQVKNQARMHAQNGDTAYFSNVDAMAHWPEKETAVAIRLLDNNEFDLIHSFDLASLFDLKITHNTKRHLCTFEKRIDRKGWLTRWPKLRVVL